MSKNKRGLSIEEKRKIILNIYHDKKEAFNLKEIENFGSKLGVVQQTIKDINQSLVDDFLVLSDKIGAANFFWSFPSKVYQDQILRKTNYQNNIQQIQWNIKEINQKIDEAKLTRNDSKRIKKLELYNQLIQEDKTLNQTLDELKVNDPEEILKVEKQALINKSASDRWTDNIWIIKSYLTKKKGMSGKEVDKMLDIKDDFDYIEYQPDKSQNKKQKK